MVISSKLPGCPCRYKGHLDRGCTAVEMALALPVPLFLLKGMIDSGRGFNAPERVEPGGPRGGPASVSFRLMTLIRHSSFRGNAMRCLAIGTARGEVHAKSQFLADSVVLSNSIIKGMY